MRSFLCLLCVLSTTPLALAANHADIAETALEDLAAQLVPTYVRIAGGSGVVISADGLMLTNHHVIARDYARRKRVFKVRVDSRNLDAQVLGTDPRGDIALLRIKDVNDLVYVGFADSDAIRVGQRVIAIGNPFGAMGPTGDPTVTFGVVSAINLYQGSYSDAIQTDAPINPGNSGGPLLDLTGRLLGINGRIQSKTRSRSNTGIGLAIPTNQITRFIPLLKTAKGGVVLHGHLPGLVGDNTESDGIRNGAEIKEVHPNSLAEQVGIQAGDRIVSMNGQTIDTFSRLRGIIGTYPANASVEIELVRQGKNKLLQLTLDKFDTGAWGFDLLLPKKRKDIMALRRKLAQDRNAKIPVKIGKLHPGSPAAKVLKKNDILLAIDGKDVHNGLYYRSLSQELARADRFWAGSSVPIRIKRGNKEMEIDLTLSSAYANIGNQGGKQPKRKPKKKKK